MLRQANAGLTSFVAIALGLLFASDASAYLDPGTGSMFVQTVIAVLAAAGYALRLYWRRVLQLFKRADDSPPAPPADRRQ